MTDTNQKQEDEVLRRMLASKPRPHKVDKKAAPTESNHKSE
ncbi:hypothetical protein [Sphingomonas edaphi]|nr:hypothetical protein [Sphingomonas edaphi]